MSDDSEYEHRNFWNYELSPFDGSVLHEGEEYDKWKRISESIRSLYANQPPDADDDFEFPALDAAHKAKQDEMDEWFSPENTKRLEQLNLKYKKP